MSQQNLEEQQDSKAENFEQNESVQKSPISQMGSINNYLNGQTFQEDELLELSKKSPKKRVETLDLLEYQACRSKRIQEESYQFMLENEKSPVHQKLYNESLVMLQKSKSRDEIIEQQIKRDSQMPKMISKTNKVLTDKMETNLTSQIQQIVGQEKTMNFEQLGRLLTVLKVFRVLVYDANCQFANQELFDDQSVYDNKRKFQEMVLHEKFWTLLAGSQTTETVSIQIVWCVLRILMDHIKIQISKKVKIIKDYIQKFRAGDEGDPDEISDFVKYWYELKVDEMAYKSIGLLKPNKYEEYLRKQSESLTFKPKINDVNYLLESHHTATFLEKHPIEGVNPEFYQSINKDYENQFYSKTLSGSIDRHALSRISALSPTRTMDRVKILYKKKEIRDDKIESQAIQKQGAELQECTFQPDVAINQRVNEWSVISKYGKQGIFQRLYTLDPLIQREQEHSAKQINDERNDMEKCTFTPAINKGLYSNDINNRLEGKDLVRGYDKQVRRLRTGNHQKELLNHQLNHIPKGENLDKEKQKPINPPSMLSRQKPKKRQPFYVIEVAMRPGKNGRIALYDGDDPYKVTESFARSFQISNESKTELFLKVKSQIDQYNSKVGRLKGKLLRNEYENSAQSQYDMQQAQLLQQQQQQQQLQYQSESGQYDQQLQNMQMSDHYDSQNQKQQMDDNQYYQQQQPILIDEQHQQQQYYQEGLVYDQMQQQQYLIPPQ